MKDILSDKDYFDLICFIKSYFENSNNGLLSVFIYGSCGRLEIIHNISDIDLMVIIKDGILSNNVIFNLDNLLKKCSKISPIRIHLRVRNIHDLRTLMSGVLDCGFVNSINKVRDSILLWGEDFDPYYINYIKTISYAEIKENLKLRVSDLRYKTRSLIGVPYASPESNAPQSLINHRIGCLICSVAEIVHYSRGQFFTTVHSACMSAAEITGSCIFSDALSYKKNLKDIRINNAVVILEKVLDDCLSFIEQSSLTELQKVRIEGHDIHSPAKPPYVQKMESSHQLVIKVSTIKNSSLIIIK